MWLSICLVAPPVPLLDLSQYCSYSPYKSDKLFIFIWFYSHTYVPSIVTEMMARFIGGGRQFRKWKHVCPQRDNSLAPYWSKLPKTFDKSFSCTSVPHLLDIARSTIYTTAQYHEEAVLRRHRNERPPAGDSQPVG
jgi:hypothetical protein